MIRWKMGGILCEISLSFILTLTVATVVFPDTLAFSCIMASLIHELGHLTVMVVLSVIPQRVALCWYGFSISMGEKSIVGYRENMLISLAGPLVNGFAFCVCYWLECLPTAMVHLLLGGINLLPFPTLDGGEILRCFCSLHFSDKTANRIVLVSSILVLLFLSAGAVILFIINGNPFLLVIALYGLSLLLFNKKR